MNKAQQDIKWDKVSSHDVSEPIADGVHYIGTYRYWWHRKFEIGKGVTVFGMLNPSIANRKRNDPTSRRCIDFARMWDSRAVIIVNLFAAVSTQPDAILELDDPVGPRNWDFVGEACRILHQEGGRFVVAWGASPMALSRVGPFVKFIREHGVTPYCLSLTKDGAPRHPLMVPAHERLRLYGE